MYSAMSQWHQSYTASEKLTIIKYAEARGNRAAEHQFDGVNEANFRPWCKQKQQLQKIPCIKKMAQREAHNVALTSRDADQPHSYPRYLCGLRQSFAHCMQRSPTVSHAYSWSVISTARKSVDRNCDWVQRVWGEIAKLDICWECV